MNTETIKRSAIEVRKHGNKLAHTASAGMLVFLFATFSTKESVDKDVANLNARCDRCDESRAAQWRRLMDHEVALARIGVTVPKPETKP